MSRPSTRPAAGESPKQYALGIGDYSTTTRVSPEKKLKVAQETAAILDEKIRRLNKFKERMLKERKEKVIYYTTTRDKKVKFWEEKYKKSPFHTDQFEDLGSFISDWEDEIESLLATCKLEDRKLADDESRQTLISRQTNKSNSPSFKSSSTRTTTGDVSVSNFASSYPNLSSSTSPSKLPRSPTATNAFDGFPAIGIESVKSASNSGIGSHLAESSRNKFEQLSNSEELKVELSLTNVKLILFHTEILGASSTSPVVITLYKSKTIQEDDEVLNFVVIKAYDTVQSNESTLILHCSDLSAYLQALVDKYSLKLSTYFNPISTSWWIANAGKILRIRDKNPHFRSSYQSPIFVSMQAIEEVVLNQFNLLEGDCTVLPLLEGSSYGTGSQSHPPSDIAREATAENMVGSTLTIIAEVSSLQLVAVHSELVKLAAEDSITSAAVTIVVSSPQVAAPFDGADNVVGGAIDATVGIDLSKYDPNHLLPSLPTQPPAVVRVKVWNVLTDEEITNDLNFKDLVNFLYLLQENYSVRALLYYNPLSIDWWKVNLNKVLSVTCSTAHLPDTEDSSSSSSSSQSPLPSRQYKMDGFISKRKIEMLVREGLHISSSDPRNFSGPPDEEMTRFMGDVRSTTRQGVHMRKPAGASVYGGGDGAAASDSEVDIYGGDEHKGMRKALSIFVEGVEGNDHSMAMTPLSSPMREGVPPLAMGTVGLLRDEDLESVESEISMLSDDSSSTSIIGLSPLKKTKTKKLKASEAIALQMIYRGRALVSSSPKFIRRKLTTVEKKLLKSPLAKPLFTKLMKESSVDGHVVHGLEVSV